MVREGPNSVGPQKVIFSTRSPQFATVNSVYAADLDGDGDMDVLSAAEKISWYEQLPRVAAGDANRDGRFDQQDIVQVLQAAKYRTGEPAMFHEGDFNGDGVFDQLDIVAALQTGNYLQGLYATDAFFAQIGH